MVALTKKLANLLSRAKNEETGNSYFLVLIVLPLAFAMFGMSMDAILYMHVQNTVQSAADSAATTAANRLYNDNSPTVLNNVTISSQNIYTSNLNIVSNYLYKTPPVKSCPGYGATEFKLKKVGNVITVQVVEKINFMFIDGIPGILQDDDGEAKGSSEAEMNASVAKINVICRQSIATAQGK